MQADPDALAKAILGGSGKGAETLPPPDPSEGELPSLESSAVDAASSELIDAVKSGDVKATSAALRAAFRSLGA